MGQIKNKKDDGDFQRDMIDGHHRSNRDKQILVQRIPSSHQYGTILLFASSTLLSGSYSLSRLYGQTSSLSLISPCVRLGRQENSELFGDVNGDTVLEVDSASSRSTTSSQRTLCSHCKFCICNINSIPLDDHDLGSLVGLQTLRRSTRSR